MFAVICHSEMEPSSLDETQLDHMVSVVSESPGFVSGYWGRDARQATTIHSVVFFDSHDNAQAFADDVLNNLARASVRVVEILTHA